VYIKKYALSGLLEKMPIDKSIYDLVIEQVVLSPKKIINRAAFLFNTLQVHI
jgi:hypothetical protein